MLAKPVGWIKILLYGVLFTGLFYSSHSVMVSWWEREDYNYCYLVPAIVLYLIWEKRQRLFESPSLPAWWGSIPIAIGILFYLLGELGGEYLSMYISSWFLLIGICWIHLGWKKLKVIAFPLFFILAMFPLPNFLQTKITLKLQLVSSQMGVAIIQLYGLSAFREGNVIDLGFTQLQVVEACSGLRYLIPLLVLGVLLAYFFKAAWWKRVVLVISTIPLSIATNSLRIALTGILHKHWGAEVAEGFFHGFSGWFIFMFSLGVLLAEMGILAKIGGRGQRTEVRDQRSEVRGQRSEGRGQRSEVGAWKALFYPPQFVAAIIVLGTTLAFSQGIEFREKIPIRKTLNQFPLDIAKWRGVPRYLDKKFIDTLDFSDYIMVNYKDGYGKNINFYMAYYESQRKGESIHSPATCLPGGGWEFSQAGSTAIFISGPEQKTIKVNRAFMQLGDVKQLSYYWFPKAGRVLTNAYQLKLYTFWDALTQQRTDGALVRLITPVYQSEDLPQAEKRLQTFIQSLLPILNEYLPGKDI